MKIGCWAKWTQITTRSPCWKMGGARNLFQARRALLVIIPLSQGLFFLTRWVASHWWSPLRLISASRTCFLKQESWMLSWMRTLCSMKTRKFIYKSHFLGKCSRLSRRHSSSKLNWVSNSSTYLQKTERIRTPETGTPSLIDSNMTLKSSGLSRNGSTAMKASWEVMSK